ncbi:plasmid partitioning protein RepB [uncultured Rhodoblastus sp.]|uniref:plasmid partitioning protein RepB n=1 Tax=uncultured Rhodoblastus sp. TaxID=543037 RepID=UPI0025E62A7D|nr:plasmid partitioning protein RepB [uncultured Rhodoblastus sp.]
MARKNLLAGLDGPELSAVNSGPSSAHAPNVDFGARPTLGTRGAVGAMSRSLERMSANIDAAKTLEQQLLAGSSIIEIDPSLIDSSFISDRMSENTVDHSSLVGSIREHGQQVPILVRPHPESQGRYQVAYGHRRLRALKELQRKAKAVVRPLTDDQLVVAQGQENSARRDLSFIERASFATKLEDRGFSREIIIAALTVDKTELSRLISSRRALPDDLIFAIGPAPKTGRRRWMDLAERLNGSPTNEIWKRAVERPAFDQLDSDSRFQFVVNALSSKSVPTNEVTSPAKLFRWINHDGRKIARIEDGADWLRISVDKSTGADFGAFLLTRLPELIQAYQTGKGDAESTDTDSDASSAR